MIKVVVLSLAIAAPSLAQTCSSSQYFDSATQACAACDDRCDGCEGPKHWDCFACAPGRYNVYGTSVKCLNTCYTSQYLSGSTCYFRELLLTIDCHAYCDGCTGSDNTSC